MIVWYPLQASTDNFRKWLQDNGRPYAELEFAHYRVQPWAGQDLRGSGIAFSRLQQDQAEERIRQVAELLMGAFQGKCHNGRRLDLALSGSVVA